MSNVYAETLKINVVANASNISKGINDSVKNIGKQIAENDTIEGAIKKQMLSSLSEFEKKLTGLDKNLKILEQKTADSVSSGKLESYIGQLTELQNQYKSLSSEVGKFSTAMEKAFGAGMDESVLTGFINTVKDLITLLSPLRSSFSSLAGMFTTALNPSTITTIDQTTQKLEKLERQLEKIDQLIAKTDTSNYTNILAEIAGRPVEEVSELNSKELDEFMDKLTKARAEFQTALDEWNKPDADHSHNAYEHLVKLAEGFETLRYAAESAGKVDIATNAAKSMENLGGRATHIIDRYYTSLVNARQKVEEELNGIKQSTVDADKALLDFKDGSIKIPVSLAASANDIVSEVSKLVSQANGKLKDHPVKIAIQPARDTKALETEVVDFTNSLLAQAHITDKNEEKRIIKAAELKHAQNVARSVAGMGEAATLLEMREAIKDLVRSVNSIRGNGIEKISNALPGVVNDTEKLLPLLESVKGNIGEGFIDFENIAKATENLKKLIEQFEKLNQVTSPKEAAAFQQDSAKNILNIMSQLSPDYKSFIKDADRKEFLKQRVVEEYRKYLNYGGIKTIDQALGPAFMNGQKVFQGYSMPIRKAIQSAFEKLPEDNRQEQFIQNIIDNINRLQATLESIDVSKTGFIDFLNSLQQLNDNEGFVKAQTSIEEFKPVLSELVVAITEALNAWNSFKTAMGENLNVDVSGIKNATEIIQAAKTLSDLAASGKLDIAKDIIKEDNKQNRQGGSSGRDINAITSKLENKFRAIKNTELQIQNLTQKKFEQMQFGDVDKDLSTYDNTLTKLNEVRMRQFKAYSIHLKNYIQSMLAQEGFDPKLFTRNKEMMEQEVSRQFKNASEISQAKHEDRMVDINAKLTTKELLAQQKEQLDNEKLAVQMGKEREKAAVQREKASQKVEQQERKAAAAAEKEEKAREEAYAKLQARAWDKGLADYDANKDELARYNAWWDVRDELLKEEERRTNAAREAQEQRIRENDHFLQAEENRYNAYWDNVARQNAEQAKRADEAKAKNQLLQEKFDNIVRQGQNNKKAFLKSEDDRYAAYWAGVARRSAEEKARQEEASARQKALIEGSKKYFDEEDAYNKELLSRAKKTVSEIARVETEIKNNQTNLFQSSINENNIARTLPSPTRGDNTRQQYLDKLYEDLKDLTAKLKDAPNEYLNEYSKVLDELATKMAISDADAADKITAQRQKVLEKIRSNYSDSMSDFLKGLKNDTLKGITTDNGEKITADQLVGMDDDKLRAEFSNLSQAGQDALIKLRDTASQLRQAINDNLDPDKVDLKNLAPEELKARLESITVLLQRYKEVLSDTAKTAREQIILENAVRGVDYENLKTIDDFHVAVDKYTSSIQGATDMSGKFSENGLKWVGTFKDANGVVQQLTLSFNQMVGVMEQSQFAKKGADVAWLTDGLGGLKAGIKDVAKMATMFVTFGSATHGAMMMVRSSLQQGRQAVLDYDKALTNIKYTMNMSQEQFDALGKSTVQMARDLKLSVGDAMTISQIYANMQTTSEEILKVGTPTAILSNLSGSGTEAAANYIQSVQMQFDLLEDEAEHIVDVYDKVSAAIKMDYAKGIQNIAGGVQAAGQVAHDAGLSFEELAAIVAKTSERTREEGSAIGNSLKTIITRISKASKLSGADEVDNETLSKASKALHDVGVEVYESNGTFRDLRDILTELASVWDDLTDAQRANISYEVAATRQTNKFKAILQSWTDSMELADAAAEAHGNALANQEKYMESMGGLIQGIKTDMEAFWLSMYNDDAIKGVLKFVANLTDLLNKAVDDFGITGILIGTTILTSLFKSLSAGLAPVLVTKLTGMFLTIGSSWGKSLLKGMGDELSEGARKTITTALGGTIVVGGIAIAIAGIAALHAALVENERQLEKSRTEAVEHSKAIKEQSDSYNSLAEKIRENRGVLESSSSTEEEIYTAKSNLYEIQNKLIETYGDEAEGIDLVNGKLERQLELIKQLSTEDANDFLNNIQETSWRKRLNGSEKTGYELAEEAKSYLGNSRSEYVNSQRVPGHALSLDDLAFNTTNSINLSGLSKEVKTIIEKAITDAGLSIKNGAIDRGELTPEEYKDALKDVQTRINDLIKGEYSDNTAVRKELSLFQGRVSGGLSEVVSAIERAYSYLDMLFVADRASYNDEALTGGVVFDDVEGALKDASEAYNKAVANGTLTKEIEEEFERAANAAKAFAMSSEEAAEEQDKVHQQINDLMRSYGKGNLDYSKRKYVQNADGSMSTIETIDEDILGGRFSVKMASTGFTDAQIDQWFETIEQGLQKKINNGEKISVDDLLELDKTNSILFAREGSYEQNKKLFNQFEDDIYLLKEYGVELERGKNRTLDTSPAEHYLKQIAEGVTGSEAYRRQQAIQQIDSSPSLKEGGLLRGKGYNILDLKNRNFQNVDDLNTYNSIVKIFEDLGLTIDDANDYLIETGACLGEISEEAEKASDEMKKVFSVSDATTELENIKKVSDAIGGLITSMNEAGDGKGLDISGLSTVQGTFKDVFPADELDAYIVRLNAAKGSAEETTAILKEMMLAWANQSQYLDQTGESYKILRDALEEVGFTISGLSDEQIDFLENTYDTIKAHQDQAESAEDAAALQADVEALRGEAEQLGITDNEWINYYLAKFSGTGTFSTAGDQAALLALIGVLDAAQKSWIDFYKARADMLKEAVTHTASMGGKLPAHQNVNEDVINKGLTAAAGAETENLIRKNGFNTSALLANDKFGLTGNKAIKDAFNGDRTKETLEKAFAAGADAQQELLESKFKEILKIDVTGGSGVDYNPPSKTDSGKGGGSGSNGSDKDKKEPKELDWIQRRIDLLEKQHEIEQDIASDEQKTYAERIASLETLRQQDQFIIDVLKAGAEEYKTTYEDAFKKVKELAGENQTLEGVIGEVDTVEELRKAIEEGAIAIDQYGEDAYEAIDTAISAYDKYQEQLDQVRQKEKEEHEHFMEEYNLRIQELQEYNSYLQAQGTNISNELALIEARGEVVTEGVYRDLIRNSEEQIDLYHEQMDVYEEMLDELDEGSAEYNQTLASIQECANAIQQCELNQIEWNEAIKDIPIKRIEKYLSIIENIKTDILNYLNEQEVIGAVVGAGPYEELMDLGQRSLNKLTEQQKLYADKLKDYDFGSEKYNETATAMEGIDSEISEIIQDMGEWTKTILNLPIERLNKINENLNITKASIDDLLDDYNTVLSGVSYLFEQQTEEIQKQRDEYEKLVDGEIEGIQAIIDALEKQNEAREKQLGLEQAEYELNRANTQKTVAVVQEGRRQFIADQEAVRAAQQAFDEAQYEKQIYDLQQQIEDLEKERDERLKAYDESLDFLDKQAEKWSTIVSEIEGARDMLMSLQYLGNGWDDKILSGQDDDIYNVFKANYKAMSDQQDVYDKQIESNNRIAELMQAYVDAFVSGSMSYEKTLSGLQSLTKNIDNSLTALENIEETRKLFGGGSFEQILSAQQQDALKEANNYPEYLKLAKANGDKLDQYTKDWQELHKQVEEEKALLEKQWKELQEQKEAQKAVASTVRRSHDGGNAICAEGTYVQVDGAGNIVKYEKGVEVERGNIRGSSLESLRERGYEVANGHYVANKYHDGIDNGAVGSQGDVEKIKALKKMSLTPLKSNEIPAILKAGEVVLNGTQQSNLLSNIKKIGAFGQKVASGVNVNLSMSNLTFHEINNGQDFANFITKNLSSAVAQGLSRA